MNSNLTEKTVSFITPNHIIVAVNIIVFVTTDLFLQAFSPAGYEAYIENFALSAQGVANGQIYRLLTSMFMHADIGHIAGNMLMIALLGDSLERLFGRVKYLILYFSTGILAGLCSIAYNILTGSDSLSLGASGAGFGLMGALLVILLKNKGRAKNVTVRQLLFYIVMCLIVGFTGTQINNAAHIGGLLAGILMGFVLYRPTNEGGRPDYEG